MPRIQYDQYGRELPDPTPIEVPIEHRQARSLEDRIRACIRQEFSRQAQDQGAETFEEADDFDIEDEGDIFPGVTVYEMAGEGLDVQEPPEGDPNVPSTSVSPPPADEPPAALERPAGHPVSGSDAGSDSQ